MTDGFDQFRFARTLISQNVQDFVDERLAIVGTLANETKQIGIGLIQLADGGVFFVNLKLKF